MARVNPMTSISCRECRSLLAAYTERSLERGRRSQVAAHLDTCDRCHAGYARQRDLMADLRSDLPALGRLEASRSGALWRSVQHDLMSPRRVALPFGQRRISLLAVLIAAALVLPWLLSPGRLAALSLPLPPTPVSASLSATDAPADEQARTAETAMLITPPSRPEYAPTQAAAGTVRPEPETRLPLDTQAR